MRPRLRPLLLPKIIRFNFKNCRKITSTAPLQSLVPENAYSFLSNRSLISISGPDSTKYLQGAVPANVNSNIIYGIYTVFLNAQGRILNDVFIFPFEEVEGRYRGAQGWLIEVDSQQSESLVKRIKRYRLDSDFEIRALPQSEKGVWSVWCDKTNESRLGNLLTSGMDKSQPESGISCVDKRAQNMGYRLLLPGNKKPELELEECHENYYKIRRYMKGVPEGQKELLKEIALPQESNIDFMGGIDYRKGCYVGQELTIRTYHTGVVRKRILPLQVYGLDENEPSKMTYSVEKHYGAEEIPVNTSISRLGGGRSTGKWLCGVGNLGLGLCRLSNMTDIRVGGESAVYEEKDEFKIEWESALCKKTVKTKVFPPAWHFHSALSNL